MNKTQIILEGLAHSPHMAASKNAGLSENNANDLVAYIKNLCTQREPN